MQQTRHSRSTVSEQSQSSTVCESARHDTTQHSLRTANSLSPALHNSRRDTEQSEYLRRRFAVQSCLCELSYSYRSALKCLKQRQWTTECSQAVYERRYRNILSHLQSPPPNGSNFLVVVRQFHVSSWLSTMAHQNIFLLFDFLCSRLFHAKWNVSPSFLLPPSHNKFALAAALLVVA